jgi:VanZ family protein
MLEKTPHEKEWISWLYVILWSVIIFVTIPLARAIQGFVAEQWGRELFTYAVLTATVVVLLITFIHVLRDRTSSRKGFFWLLAVAAVFVAYTLKLGQKSPEEAIHFIQYGVLGILVYRALLHRIRDITVYFAAATLCGIIGIVDETIQWLTPGRFWGLRDIWINFFSACLVQVAIAKGLKPKIIAIRPSLAGLSFLCRIALVAVGVMGLNMLNTPERISWYAEHIPGLASLESNESLMLEYGHLYVDQDIGIFRSRFTPDMLRENDRLRGKEAAAILDRFKDGVTYGTFLRIYTPITDPFVHEARVHLFRRDKYFEAAEKHRNDPAKYAECLTIAFRENQIMEKYFTTTLHHSDYVWSEEQLGKARNNLLQDTIYESHVSLNLITRVSEAQMVLFFVFLIMVLVVLYGYICQKSANSPTTE